MMNDFIQTEKQLEIQKEQIRKYILGGIKMTDLKTKLMKSMGKYTNANLASLNARDVIVNDIIDIVAEHFKFPKSKDEGGEQLELFDKRVSDATAFDDYWVSDPEIIEENT